MKRPFNTIATGLGLAFAMSLLLPTSVLAQQGEGEGAMAGLCIVGLIVLAVNIAILVWVIKDAQARGTSPGAWLVVVLLFGVLGLLAYLIARPKGKLVPCPECGKKKPIGDPICPHCGKRVV